MLLKTCFAVLLCPLSCHRKACKSGRSSQPLALTCLRYHFVALRHSALLGEGNLYHSGGGDLISTCSTRLRQSSGTAPKARLKLIPFVGDFRIVSGSILHDIGATDSSSLYHLTIDHLLDDHLDLIVLGRCRIALGLALTSRQCRQQDYSHCRHFHYI